MDIHSALGLEVGNSSYDLELQGALWGTMVPTYIHMGLYVFFAGDYFVSDCLSRFLFGTTSNMFNWYCLGKFFSGVCSVAFGL